MAWSTKAALFAAALLLPAGLATAQQFQNTNTTALVTLTAAGAGTTDSPDQYNAFSSGAIVGVNISAKTGTISVTVAIQGKDIASGQYYQLCQTAALTAAGFVTLMVHPGLTAAANTVCNVPLPPTWRVEVVSGTGTTPAVTMTVGAALIF
jgi:2-keto-3-deoxy-galactonokinase